MKKLLQDYGIPQEMMSVFCDNTSAINLSKNPVQHLKSKHIEICYHFIRDLVEDKIMCLEFFHMDNQKADIFTISMVHGSNRFVRPSASIPFLESHVCCVFYISNLIWSHLSKAHTSLMVACFYCFCCLKALNVCLFCL